MSTPALNRRFCVAPMLDWTDRHARFFLRQLSRHALLYTEMVTCGAILHGDQQRHLQFSNAEQPVALQLGGSDPKELAQCARISEQYGYQEINLNVGCPSDRVQSGRFGACLMAAPELVGDCIAAMQAEVSIPVTVKCRIGIDHQESYEEFAEFIDRVASAGCQVFIVHARKAWLEGLSPKQNREIPPLHYDYVYRLKQQSPDLEIIINGGIGDLDACQQHLHQVDGVMMGRAAYQNPYLLRQVDPLLYSDNTPVPTRHQAIRNLYPYIEQQLSAGSHLNHITRHVLGLFQGVPGAKRFRRHLSENAHKKGSGIEVLQQALALVPEDQIDER